ncbi:integral membrane protein 2B-like isoform X2 [Stegostoma tigrinum]|uniref:integral membrane protein 2B-like isoform X2 n=1 Tax=Stegostoma tigrinum TaxID=3053191 RepID=UPI00286FE657|nr:integral membrane protein 2B-like isoform X2 [Stegostoma tigrinum]
MVKVSFNSSLSQKEPKKEENNEALVIHEKDPEEDVVPFRRQSRVWCWCMCLGLALLLSGVVVGGAYLYRYFILQEGEVFFCGLKYSDPKDYHVPDVDVDPQLAPYQSIKENIRILEDDGVELINVLVPEFADGDPADIVHDFHRGLTAYLDLNLDKCYMIPLNSTIVMPPRNLFELLINVKAGTYLPQSYLIHEEMVVTDYIENVDELGYFIARLCRGKETFKLQRRELGIQKRDVKKCFSIFHFESRVAVETLICEQ